MKLVENKDYKITVEETSNGYIATYWDKNMSLEVDRYLEEFETFGGAMDCAFEFLAEVNNLKVIDK
jgi:hypothetical protein